MGGPLAFWKASLHSLQAVLDAFGQDLREEELRLQAHPHPISGALDFQQRIEFLRFHIDRHKEQVSQLLTTQAGYQRFCILSRMIFDGEKLSELFAPLDLGWKERTKRELALMDEWGLEDPYVQVWAFRARIFEFVQ